MKTVLNPSYKTPINTSLLNIEQVNIDSVSITNIDQELNDRAHLCFSEIIHEDMKVSSNEKGNDNIQGISITENTKMSMSPILVDTSIPNDGNTFTGVLKFYDAKA